MYIMTWIPARAGMTRNRRRHSREGGSPETMKAEFHSQPHLFIGAKFNLISRLAWSRRDVIPEFSGLKEPDWQMLETVRPPLLPVDC